MSANILKEISFDRSLTPSIKKLMQRMHMPTSLTPNIPPKTPNMSHGALEKEMRDHFSTIIAQHTL